MRHIIPISGKDSLATALVQRVRRPDINYEYVFNPTGLDLPETLSWIDRVETYLERPIQRVGGDLREIIAGYNYFLPSQMARYCTRQAKIEPFVKWIGGDECVVYYGIRADENRSGFDNTTSQNITVTYPLAEEGLGIRAVLEIVNHAGLKPPSFFWQSLYTEVVHALGHDPRPTMPEYIFDMLFSWRSRSNCDRCFNQRYYEWVGLSEYYPVLFWEAESWEHLGGGKSYTWSSNKKSLRQIYEEREIIKRKRVNQVVKVIQGFQQTNVFKDEDADHFDVLSVKSCGLFCGK